MRVLVTGGNGFIGKYVVEALRASNHFPYTLDAPQDVRDISQHYGGFGIDAVIHLAGRLGTAELFDPNLFDEAVDVNVKGAQRVLEFCSDADARFIGITMPDVWANVYQATKKCAGILATAWHESFGVPVTHVRAFNAFGAGQKHGPGHPQKIIPTFSTLAYAGTPIPINGDGTQTVDLISAKDVASVLVQALDAPGNNEIIDAGTCYEQSVLDVAKYVIHVTGSTAGVEHLPMRPGERPHTYLCATGEGWDLLIERPVFDYLDLREAIESYKS